MNPITLTTTPLKWRLSGRSAMPSSELILLLTESLGCSCPLTVGFGMELTEEFAFVFRFLEVSTA